MNDTGWPGATQSTGIALLNARLVTPEAEVAGGIALRDGLIAACGADLPGPGSGADIVHDCEGDYLIPGIVDLHTDHVERHALPRAHVQWNADQALAAHDAVVISGGTTTVFDSLCVGASVQHPERREMLAPLVEAIERGMAEGRFRAEHLIHMRCEITDPQTPALAQPHLDRPIVRLVSVMDHTPGDRQSPDTERWLRATSKAMQISLEEGRAVMAELLERSARVGAGVEADVIAMAREHGLPVMSHDDRTEAHVDAACAAGVQVSEFPTTLAAARHARATGLGIVAGAPNILRGGSQSGNVAVHALLAEGLVDALASDYVPRSPLEAAFAIADDPSLPIALPQAVAMVTATPARMAGLTDRGTLALGQRADLVQVRRAAGRSHVVAVWRAGRRVY
ncbi:MAG: alpha-D-ribose 1-methylphosphonate 5-triphosphate diphosphatase [Pseudomonadota bacterium]